MSSDRVPEGDREIVLRVYLKDRMATVEACWDTPVGLSWLDEAQDKQTIQGTEWIMHIITKNGSEKIPRVQAIAIAERWLKGEYLTVEFSG